MGWRASWAATRDIPVEALMERFGLEVAPDQGGSPDRSEFWSWRSSEGWTVLAANRHEGFFYSEALRGPSRGGELVGYAVSETVNGFWAYGFRDGQQVWAIERVMDEGEDVRLSGEVPASLRAVVEGLRAREMDEDGEDFELDLASEAPALYLEQLTGFHPFKDLPAGPPPPVLLRQVRKPGFFSRLFGRS